MLRSLSIALCVSFYVTVVEVCPRIAHQAINTSLEKQKNTFKATVESIYRDAKVGRANGKVPAVCGDALVTAVLFVPVFALHGLVGAAGSDADVGGRSRGHGWSRGYVHLHLHLKDRY